MRATTYLRLLTNVRGYNRREPVIELERALGQLYGTDAKCSWFTVSNGRSALDLLFSSLESRPGDEIIVQSFTCVTAVNPVVWNGFTPIFADVAPGTFSPSVEDIERLITPHTRAIVLQHTFGLTAPVHEIVALAKSRDILVIEDCSHALASPITGQKLGTFGDAAIISFGVDKTLPTVFGGAVLVSNPQFARDVAARYEAWTTIATTESLRWLIYPLLVRGLKALPNSIRGKTRGLLVRLGWLRISVTTSEYKGGKAPGVSQRLSGVHASVISHELKNLPQNAKHRRAIVSLYAEVLSGMSNLQAHHYDDGLIKYPVICESPELRAHILQEFTLRGLPLITWYSPAIFPQGVNLSRLGYDPATCPVAEDLATRIISLPTGPAISAKYATMIANELIAATTSFQRPA